MNAAEPSRSSIGISRSAVGRASSNVSRLFGGTSTVQATGRFLRRQLWAWPIIAAVVLGGAGWWVHQSVENALRDQRAIDLNTMVDASANALRVWMDEQQVNVRLIAGDKELAPLVSELLKVRNDERQLVQSPAQASLRSQLRPKMNLGGYVGYFVVAPDGIVVAADQDAPVGKTLAGYRKEIFDPALVGKTTVSKPFRSPLLLTDENGELRANLPSMFVTGPLNDGRGETVAALGLRIRPGDQFTRILQVVRFGASGETFAFDEDGLLISQSRFDDLMKQIGLLADQPDARSILTVSVRDPGVNMADGQRPALRRADQPLTRMAAEAVQGKDGHDADGYRGYRGVPRVGAWRWLPEYDFGIATEVDAAEALGPANILRRAFWVLMALLVLSAIGIFVAMLYLARQQRALQSATNAIRQLGQYALEAKIGAGGMGTVYRARHAMLRRPTAIKLLDTDKMSGPAIARFEREVQLTGGLTHPNTVAVFDYGRTPDGVFYYAMEYLEGMNLDEFVKKFGPLPEARMVHFLRQVCGSLAEAHAQGLVHRDIKPANIFLTCRGGLHDFVKVLDFGLAKAVDSNESANVTNPNALMGTPLYLSPEGVNHPESVDARSDVYAVGAVGYFLLTGTPVFNGATILEICMKHAKETPETPSSRRGKPVSADLEALLMRCLAKAPNDRPANAGELLALLVSCRIDGAWSSAEAAAWWAALATNETVVSAATPPPAQQVNTPAPDATLAHPSRVEKG